MDRIHSQSPKREVEEKKIKTTAGISAKFLVRRAGGRKGREENGGGGRQMAKRAKETRKWRERRRKLRYSSNCTKEKHCDVTLQNHCL